MILKSPESMAGFILERTSTVIPIVIDIVIHGILSIVIVLPVQLLLMVIGVSIGNSALQAVQAAA